MHSIDAGRRMLSIATDIACFVICLLLMCTGPFEIFKTDEPIEMPL